MGRGRKGAGRPGLVRAGQVVHLEDSVPTRRDLIYRPGLTPRPSLTAEAALARFHPEQVAERTALAQAYAAGYRNIYQTPSNMRYFLTIGSPEHRGGSDALTDLLRVLTDDARRARRR